MDSDSEDEIFFGPVTLKEEQVAAPIRNRKTEIFVPDSSVIYRRSSVPSLASLEEEECKTSNPITDQCQQVFAPDLADSVAVCVENAPKNVLNKEDEGDFVILTYESFASFSGKKTDDLSFAENRTVEIPNSDMYSCPVKEDILSPVVTSEYDVSLFGLEKKRMSLSCEEVAKGSSKKDCVKVTEENVLGVSDFTNRALSSTTAEVIKNGSLLVTVDNAKRVTDDTVVTSEERLTPDNTGISDVLLLSSFKNTGEVAQQNCTNVTEGVIANDNTEIRRETMPLTSAGVCQGEMLANVNVKDKNLSFADVDVGDEVIASLGTKAIGKSVSVTLMRVQEEAFAEMNDESSEGTALIGGVEDTRETESVSKILDVYMPVDHVKIGESIIIHNSKKVSEDDLSLSCLALTEGSSVPSMEICEDCDSNISLSSQEETHSLANSETLEAIPVTNESVTEAAAYTIKQEGGKDNRATLPPDSDFLSFKEGQDVAFISQNEALPLEIGNGFIGNCEALYECKGPEIDVDMHVPKDSDDSDSINNYLKCCFCKEVGVDTILTDRSNNDCVCSRKSSVEIQVTEYSNRTDILSSCASEKQFTSAMENLPSHMSKAEISNLDSNLYSEPNSSTVNTHSDYSQPVDSSTESYGTVNKGLIFSQTPDLDSGLLSSSYDCSPSRTTVAPSEFEMRSLLPVNSGVSCSNRYSSTASSNTAYSQSAECVSELKFPSGLENLISPNGHVESQTVHSPRIVNSPVEVSPDESYTNDEGQNETSSPTRKFNDTIEEMEMLLKYGVHYGEIEGVANNYSDTDKKNCMNQESDCVLDDSIVSPRKSSVLSSVSNFDPEFNSTCVPSAKTHLASAKIEGNVGIQGTEKLDSHSPLPKVNKALPPPKPPRNVHTLGASPLKSNSPQACNPNQQVKSHVTPVLPEEKHLLRKENIVKQGISKSNLSSPKAGFSRSNPSTRRCIGVKSKPKSGMSTPKVDSRNLYKTSTMDIGVTRSASLTNIPNENKLKPATPFSPLCTSSMQKNNALCGHHIPKFQTPRSAVKEKILHKQGLTPQSAPGRCVEKPPMGRTSKTLHRDKVLNLNPMARKHAHLKQASMNIVSPVARYLRENPPPPLVINVKPRHKIMGNVEKLSQRDSTKASNESDVTKCKEIKQRPNNAPVLPVALYSPAVPVLLENTENKENERSRKLQEISGGSHQLLVMKHKGRVKVPKVKFKDEVEKNCSPKGYRSPNPVEAAVTPVRNSTVRGSLMEVSIYEPHKTQYSDTLK